MSAGLKIEDLSVNSRSLSETPFADNGEFLEAHYAEMRLLVRCADLRRRIERSASERVGLGSEEDDPDRFVEGFEEWKRLEQMEQEYQAQKAANADRLAISSEADLPWADLVEQFRLDEFEQQVLWLLFFKDVSPDFRRLIETLELDSFGDEAGRHMHVGNLLEILCPGSMLRQVEMRRYFSVDAPLVVHHLIQLDPYSAASSSILEVEVEMAPRVVAWISGDSNQYIVDTPFQVEQPEECLTQVILPARQLDEVLSLFDNYDEYQRQREALGLDQVVRYGRAMTLLEYGPPGTGKTLLARALAHHTGRPLVSLRRKSLRGLDRWNEDYELRELFREAQLRNGIVFIDECERLCSRESEYLPHLLIELERADVMVVMATNRPEELAPELDRRFTLKIPFSLPDAQARLRIWQIHLRKVPLGRDVDLEKLAHDYPMAGGYIKNAVLAAVNLALSRRVGAHFALTQRDLEIAARMQEKHVGRMNRYRKAVQPCLRLNDLLLSPKEREDLLRLVRTIAQGPGLLRQWGVGSSLVRGVKILMSGRSPGAAWQAIEAVAGEVGKTIEQIDLPLLFRAWEEEERLFRPGWPSSLDMGEVFEAARGTGHLLVLVDEQGCLEELADQSEEGRYRSFFRRLATFEGVACLLTAARRTKLPSWARVFHVHLRWEAPETSVRRKYWDQALGKIPRDEEVKVEDLAARYELSLEQIQDALHRAVLQIAADGRGDTLKWETLETAIETVLREEKTGQLFG